MASFPHYAKAIMRYHSPDEDQLSFEDGEVVKVLSASDEDNHLGESLDGSRKGVFPKEFAEQIDESEVPSTTSATHPEEPTTKSDAEPSAEALAPAAAEAPIVVPVPEKAPSLPPPSIETSGLPAVSPAPSVPTDTSTAPTTLPTPPAVSRTPSASFKVPTPQTVGAVKIGGMSASDAQASIGQGGSLKDRMKMFQAQAAQNAAPPPPIPRAKPAGAQQWAWKNKVAAPPASTSPSGENPSAAPPSSSPGSLGVGLPSSTPSEVSRKPSNSGFSADDAKAAVGKGQSLKERMAALQGAGAFGAPTPAAPPVPSGKPKVWKRPEVPEGATALPPIGLMPVSPAEEGEGDGVAAESAAPSEELAEGEAASTVKESTASEEPAGEEDEEEAERARRAAIAARMAKIGARGPMGMMMAPKPVVRKSSTGEDVVSPPPAPPADPVDGATPPVLTPSEESIPDPAPTPVTVAPIEQVPADVAVPAAMAMPAMPRRAAPPRKKGASAAIPPPPAAEPTGETESSPTAAAAPALVEEPTSTALPPAKSELTISAPNPDETPIPKTEEQLKKEHEYELAGAGAGAAAGAAIAGIALGAPHGEQVNDQPLAPGGVKGDDPLPDSKIPSKSEVINDGEEQVKDAVEIPQRKESIPIPPRDSSYHESDDLSLPDISHPSHIGQAPVSSAEEDEEPQLEEVSKDVSDVKEDEKSTSTATAAPLPPLPPSRPAGGFIVPPTSAANISSEDDDPEEAMQEDGAEEEDEEQEPELLPVATEDGAEEGQPEKAVEEEEEEEEGESAPPPLPPARQTSAAPSITTGVLSVPISADVATSPPPPPPARGPPAIPAGLKSHEAARALEEEEADNEDAPKVTRKPSIPVGLNQSAPLSPELVAVEVDPEDEEAARRKTIAARMAKLGGMGMFRPPVPQTSTSVESKPTSLTEDASEISAVTSPTEEASAEVAEEDDEAAEKARKARIMAKMGKMGGMSMFGMPMREPETEPEPEAELAEETETEENFAPTQIFTDKEEEAGFEEVQPEEEDDLEPEDEERLDVGQDDEENEPEEETPPPPPPARKPSAATSLPPLPPSSSTTQSPSYVDEPDEVPQEEEENTPPPPPRPTRAAPPPGLVSSPSEESFEPAAPPTRRFSLNKKRSSIISRSSLDASRPLPPVEEPAHGAPVSDPVPSAAHGLSHAELVELSDSTGAVVLRNALSLLDQSKKAVIVDGTSMGFVKETLYMSRAVGPPESEFGYLCFVQSGPSIQKRFDDIRPGDVVVFIDAFFKGKKGLAGYQQTVGTSSDPGIGIVAEFEGKKSKLRIIQATGKANSYPTLENDSYRLEDLKSGTVQVYRPGRI